MKNLADYLIPAEIDDPDTEHRICYSIEQIEKNPYYYGPADKTLKHYQLNVWGEYRFMDEDPSTKWLKGELKGDGSGETFAVIPIKFHETSYLSPSLMTIERFSEHVYKECRAAMLAFDYGPKKRYLAAGWQDIGLDDVYRYLKNLHKDYSKTEDFIRDFDAWRDRLWQTCKFIYYLSGWSDWTHCNVVVGERIYDFLDLAEYMDSRHR